ncbi:MAG: hypothetical protein DMD69_09665 [Gemmatimonadetes bacterium]|nr:MAG: hypothetical protein DMD69_09665 [Gemmatimonadota bacterium]
MKHRLPTSAHASFRARDDKWYLGAGDGLIWAPPFPQWLDAPGFWDEAHLFQYAIRPLFTVTFLTDGHTVPVRCLRRRWTPAALTLDHALGPWRACETRSAPGGELASEWELRNPTARAANVDVVVWTGVDGASLAAADVYPEKHALRFTREVTDRRDHRARVAHRLTLDPSAQSFGAYRSEPSAPALPPRFDLTPFYDRWQRSGRLRDQLHLEGIDAHGVMYLGLQRRFRLPPRGTARFSASVALALEAGRGGGGGKGTGDADRASARLPHRSRASDRPGAAAERRWHEFFASVPSFRCSDAYLDRHWRYRWYGLRLNAIAGGIGNYAHPTVCEGIGYFHVPITYSAQCHVRELRWLANSDWARGVLRTFLAHQNPDGSLPGRVYVDHLRGTDFYHADWGGALDALEAVHPDPSFEAEVYPALVRYAAWLLRTRDADHTGMIDVVNQFETGQEYMSRYQAVDPEADRVGWESRIRLKGVDVTVYAYRLLRALERLAERVSVADVGRWREAATRTGRAVLDKMWDPAAEMFFDVNPRTARPTSVKAAVCFYPYGTDLADTRHIAGLERHLFEPAEFWTEYPVPSSSVDDPLFNPDAEWNRATPPGRMGGAAGAADPAVRPDDDLRRRSRPAELLRALSPPHRPAECLPGHRRLPALLGERSDRVPRDGRAAGRPAGPHRLAAPPRHHARRARGRAGGGARRGGGGGRRPVPRAHRRTRGGGRQRRGAPDDCLRMTGRIGLVAVAGAARAERRAQR